MEKVRNGEIHYISWAIPGLTFAADYIRQVLKVDSDTYKSLFREINTKKETGTVYPKAYMTFLPIEKANYYSGTEIHNNYEYTVTEVFAQIKDVLRVNKDYIKAKILYIDIRDIEVDNGKIGRLYYIPEMFYNIIKYDNMKIHKITFLYN
jgi:hypothetical protein